MAMSSSSQKSQESDELHQSPDKLHVTILALEWGSTKDRLSTIKRELAIQLAKCPEVKISVFLPQCSEKDKRMALGHRIEIVEATRLPGYDELEWLSFPPDHLQIDVIVGHGVKLGYQAQVIRESRKCKWVQVVHTVPEELGMFKSYQNALSAGVKKHKVELELWVKADFVVGVGSKLCKALGRYLLWCKKDENIFDITPGIFDEFVDVEHAAEERERCSILVFGNGNAEDFQLKDFDIAGKAVSELNDAHLVFVGVPDGKDRDVAEHLLECGLPAHRLTVRSFLQNREDLKRLFCEVNLVLIPRTEGFGLTGLEALSAGLPVLVSKNSGFGEALRKVPFGSTCVIDSEDPLVWAEAIKKVWIKGRETRLQEAEVLRSFYKKEYSWAKQSEDLVSKMVDIINQGNVPELTSIEEESNYAHLCQILVILGLGVLRETFDRIVPPQNLQKDLKDFQVHRRLQSLRKQRILTLKQWGQLYPDHASLVSSKDFDPTLLMVLLRAVYQLTPPTAGWDALPHAADTSCEADIARVRYFINTVLDHADKACVNNAVFFNCYDNIRETLVRLGGAGYGDAMDKIMHQKMDPVTEEHYKELLKQWKKNEDCIKDKMNELHSATESYGDEKPSLCMKHDVIKEAAVGLSERLESDQTNMTCKIRNLSLKEQNTCINIVKNTSEPGTKTDKIYQDGKSVKKIQDKAKKGREYNRLASKYFNQGNFEKAIEYLVSYLTVCKEVGNTAGEGRTYGNLGKAYLAVSDSHEAINCHQLQLSIAKQLRDRAAEGRAYSSLGNAYFSQGDLKKAIDNHKQHLDVTRETGDTVGEGCAYANIGSVYLSHCKFQEAIEYHKLHLNIAKEINDRAEEGNAYASLGNAYLSLGDFSKALECHHFQLSIAKELGDTSGEAGAYANLGIGYESLGNFKTAIEYHEQDLGIAKEVKDRASEGRAYANLGNAYFSLGDFRKAIEYHEQHLGIAKEVGDKAGEGSAYGNLGIGYRNLGNFKDAIVYHEQHLSIAKQMGDRTGEGRAYCNLGIAYWNLGDFNRAMCYHELHLGIAKDVNDRAAEGAACGNLGIVYRSLGDFTTAVEYHLLHLSISREVGDRAGEGGAYANLGNVYESLGDFKKAIGYHQHHLQIAREVGDKAGEGRAYGNLGNAFDSLGDFKRAIDYHQHYLQIAKDVKDKVGEGRAYANLGIAYHNIGNFKKAIDLHHQHLSIVKDIGDRSGEGGAYANLGNAFDSLGDFTKAKEYHNLHLGIAKELGDRAGVGKAYANLGNTYRNQGDIKQAISYHQLDLAIAKEAGDRAGEGRAYGNLGISYHSLGDFKKAIDYQRLNLSIAKEMGDRAGEGRAYANLGNAFDSIGDFKEAISYHQQHLKIAEEVGDHAGEGQAYANLGNAFLSLDNYNKAIEYHQRHLSIAKEVEDRVGEGRAYANLGNAFLSLHEFQKAMEYHQKHLSIAKEVGDIAGEGGAYANLGNIYIALGKLEKALYCHEQHLHIANKVGDIASEGYAYASLGDTYLTLGELGKSENCYKSSVELFDNVRERLCSQDEWKISIRNHHNRVYTSLWVVQLKQHKIKEALLTAEQGRAQALTDLINSCYGFEIMPSLKPHEKDEQKMDTWYYVTSPTVFIAVGREEVNFWVLMKDKDISFRQTKIGQHSSGVDAITFLNCLVKDVCRETQNCSNSSNSSPLRLLHDVLISPISDLIGCQEVVFVPDGPLFLAPFAAFQDHSDKFLCDSVRTRLIPSLTSLKLIADCTEWYHIQSGVLLVGDPQVDEIDFSYHVGPLPFARKEVECIGQILNVQPLTGKNATKLEVLEQLNSVALIHIAAHGKIETGEICLCPNPMRSSNVPQEEDFILTMEDVLRTRVRARLVVLSCCHSGCGEIKAEGVVGIARAFLGAGACSILVSLWAIDDGATFEFMTCFYRQLVEGKSVSEAVNMAQKHLKNSEEFNAVSHWAPYVLIGSDTTLDPNIWQCGSQKTDTTRTPDEAVKKEKKAKGGTLVDMIPAEA